MPQAEPLPFRLPIPGRDTIDSEGARSVTYRIEGFLHFGNDLLTLEWTGTERTQQVSFVRIRDHVDPLPVEWLDVPVRWITEVRLGGGWWRPRLVLRARRLDAFDGVPAARPGSLTLRIRRRDRALARHLAAAIDLARTEATLTADGGRPELGGADVAHPENDCP